MGIALLFVVKRIGVAVSDGTVQDIVGHQRATITGSTYSGKSTLAMRREAIDRLAYPLALKVKTR